MRSTTVNGFQSACKALIEGYEDITISYLSEDDHKNYVHLFAKDLGANNKCKILWLHSKQFGPESGKAIGDALKINSTLQMLSLWDNNIGDSGAISIGHGLGKYKSLQGLVLLDLSKNNIGPEGGKAIGSGLVKNKSLKELNLDDNRIGDEGAIAIGEGLSKNNTLLTLGLWDNNIRDHGAIAIGQGLAKNKSLKELKLSWNNIRYSGAQAIGEALKENLALQELNLGFNCILAKGAKAIGEALKVNFTLQELNLSGNKIGELGARALGEALKTNSTLQDLCLRSNNIRDRGVNAIVKGLVHNNSVSQLDLGNIKEDIKIKITEILERNRKNFFRILQDCEAKQLPISDQVQNLCNAISNIPELRIFYTLTSLAFKSSAITRAKQMKLMKTVLGNFAKTYQFGGKETKSLDRYKLILERAEEDGLISHESFLEFVRYAERQETGQSPAIKTMFETLQEYEKKLRGHGLRLDDNENLLKARENSVESLYENVRIVSDELRNYDKAYQEYRNMGKTFNMFSRFLRLLSFGIGNSDAQIASRLLYEVLETTVDFTNLKEIVEITRISRERGGLASGKGVEELETIVSHMITNRLNSTRATSDRSLRALDNHIFCMLNTKLNEIKFKEHLGKIMHDYPTRGLNTELKEIQLKQLAKIVNNIPLAEDSSMFTNNRSVVIVCYCLLLLAATWFVYFCPMLLRASYILFDLAQSREVSSEL